MVKHNHKAIKGWFTYPGLYEDMVDKFPSGSVFVEVGAYRGQSLSYLLVEMVNAGKMFSVFAVDSFVMPGCSFDFLKFNLRHVRNKFKIIVGDSAASASSFEDKSLDFVFIDANHEYEFVKKDILAWLPKIKEGGILAGHDYPSYSGVVQAVDELFGDKNDKKYLNEFCWSVTI